MHKSVNDFLPKAEAKKTELKDEINASERTDTPLGGTGENLLDESGGSDTRSTGASELSSVGTGGEQTDTNNNVGGLGDAEANAPSQNTADGAGVESSQPSIKKGDKPTSK